ncbi:hypothetical protein lbkm_0397 [Lachnospiraceae bacterium KM106-2]|nr:hypothetical protein lbkm_0397 [Lachnospiraceae bacterium KM106-2]
MDNRYNSGSDTATQYTYITIMALVDSIIPRTPLLAELFGEVLLYGALDLYTDEYMVMILNNYTIPLSDVTAQMLNIAAKEYMGSKGIVSNDDPQRYTLFVTLSSIQRFQALTLLDNIEVYFSDVIFFQQYPGLLSIASSINRFTMLGYYSEWYGYGTTRLEQPNSRVLQYYPLSWDQVGYPGPSLSYIAYVNDYYQIKEKLLEDTI